MSAEDRLQIRVTGNLPRPELQRIADAVRKAALEEVADLDLAPPLREWPLTPPATASLLRDAPVLADPLPDEQPSILDQLILGIILRPEQPFNGYGETS